MADKKNNQDLGFGTKIGKAGDRLVNPDGSFNIRRKGMTTTNAYQILTQMPNGQFIVTLGSFFILVNSLFACLFLLVGVEQLNGVPRGGFISDFLYAFFFSVQTFTTVGYGGITPIGISANFVAALCASIGLIAFALATGLLFARFSRPRTHIKFSRVAVLAAYQKGMSFQCRIVNTRNHKIVNLSAQITMTWTEEKNGKFQRRYANLPLERNSVVLFPLNWTLVHPIKEASPMYGKNLEDLKKIQAEFLVMISGFDESYHQQIHTNTSYISEEVEENVKFAPMYFTANNKETLLDLDLLDKTE